MENKKVVETETERRQIMNCAPAEAKTDRQRFLDFKIKTGGNRMKLTKEYLKKMDACSAGIEWFSNQKETDGEKVVGNLIKQNKNNWANWLMARMLNKINKVEYGVFAAELVLKIYEDKYPNNDRPRKAIDAAKKYIKNPSIKNANAAYSAAYAAYAAAYSADAAYAAAYAAYSASDAAAYSAAAAYSDADAAYAADAATCSADAAYADADAAYSADADANAKKKETQIKILKYGIKLLKLQKEV